MQNFAIYFSKMHREKTASKILNSELFHKGSFNNYLRGKCLFLSTLRV